MVIIGLTLSGLALTGGAGTASAAPAHPVAPVRTATPAHTAAAHTTAPGHTIATAGTLTPGNDASGGGGPIDFWKVHLNGGDIVQIATRTPTSFDGGCAYYAFGLWAPGTTDQSFSQQQATTLATTPLCSVTATVELQAPYTATFDLAVCENAGGCLSTGGVMQAYSFTPTLINGGIPGPVAAGEIRASPTIAGAGPLTVGHLEAGGGTPIDFWKVALNGGDHVQITTGTPSTSFDGGCVYYNFGLWPQGTTDTSFSQVPAVSSATTPCGSSQAVLSLTAPSTGTYVFGLCEDTGDCRTVDLGGGIDPIQPYTFTTALTGGNETSTAIKLSSSRVRYAIEQKIKVTATVKALFGGTASGKVVITTGKTTVCTIATLSGGAGTCALARSTLLKVGKYPLTAAYSGNLASSTGAAMLTVVPNYSTGTMLRLSSTTITYGHEMSLKLTVTAWALYGGIPSGTIVITEGRQTICTIATMVKGTGYCHPASRTLVRAGRYALVATYSGHYLGSRSSAVMLTVKP